MKNPNKRSAFTVAELVITMIVLAFLVFILLGFMNRDRQKEFDAKINKTSANLSGVVNKALLQKTGKYGADSQITPQEIYTDLIQGQDVFNIVETCADNSCWGDELIGGENLDGKTKIVLNDGSAIAFGDNNIFIDANGLKKPNVMGKDVRKWNGEYRRPDVVKTTAVCAAPREEHNSLCCEPLGANEVWKAKGCNKCKRETKPTDSSWGAEGTDKACTPTCNDKNKIIIGNACKCKPASPGMGRNALALDKNAYWDYDACQYKCNVNTDDRETVCCPKNTNSKKEYIQPSGSCVLGCKNRNEKHSGAALDEKTCKWNCTDPKKVMDASGNCVDKKKYCENLSKGQVFSQQDNPSAKATVPDYDKSVCTCFINGTSAMGGTGGFDGRYKYNGREYSYKGWCSSNSSDWHRNSECRHVCAAPKSTVQRISGHRYYVKNCKSIGCSDKFQPQGSLEVKCYDNDTMREQRWSCGNP